MECAIGHIVGGALEMQLLLLLFWIVTDPTLSKNFIKIRQQLFEYPADRQISKQKKPAKNALLGGGNNAFLLITRNNRVF